MQEACKHQTPSDVYADNCWCRHKHSLHQMVTDSGVAVCCCLCRAASGARSPGADPVRPISAALAGLQVQQQRRPQQQQRPMSVLQSPGRGFAAAPSEAQNAECLQTLLGLCTQLDRCGLVVQQLQW